MPEGGFLEQKPRSPGSLTIVIALHAAAIGALALSKMEVETERYTPIKIKDVLPDPTPPPEPPPKPKEQDPVRPTTKIDYVKQEVTTPPRQSEVVMQPGENIKFIDLGPPGDVEAQRPVDPPKPPPPPPPADPIRTQARLDSRSELQPPYPASEQRAEREGSVTIMLTIGADGRVKAVQKVRATSDAFFRETERHALRNWRFKPATLDGKPVESSTRMTVHFKLND